MGIHRVKKDACFIFDSYFDVIFSISIHEKSVSLHGGVFLTLFHLKYTKIVKLKKTDKKRLTPIAVRGLDRKTLAADCSNLR